MLLEAKFFNGQNGFFILSLDLGVPYLMTSHAFLNGEAG